MLLNEVGTGLEWARQLTAAPSFLPGKLASLERPICGVQGMRCLI